MKTSPLKPVICPLRSKADAWSTGTATALFDHLVGASDQRRGEAKAERLRGRLVEDEIELGRLFDGQVARLRTLEDLVDIVGGASKDVREVCAIRHQASRLDKLPRGIHRRQSCAQCRSADDIPL